MTDQANELRRLVLRTGRTAAAAEGPRPQLVVVLGGKGGVGTTTIATRLAMALAQDGRRTVLIDADLDGPDVAALLSIEERHTLADVLLGARTVHEVLVRGPAGLLVAPGPWGRAATLERLTAAHERLVRELLALGPHAEHVIVDAGRSLGPLTRRLWHSADRVVVVTTTDHVAVMDAYAAIKVLSTDRYPTEVLSVVNRASSGAEAAEIHDRLARVCQRFLSLELRSGGSVPHDPGLSVALDLAGPGVPGAAAAALERLAARLVEPSAFAAGHAAGAAPAPRSAPLAAGA